jgi:hypothetical protein
MGQHRDGATNRRRHGADERVAVLDVRQLVAMTPSSSLSDSSRMMPSVAATAA